MDHTTRQKRPPPLETDTHRRKLVMVLIISKHPDTSPPVVEAFRPYASMSNLIELDITANIVENVSKKMQGAVGLYGIDTVS